MTAVEQVARFLSDGEWHKAREIYVSLGVDPRTMREMAEASGEFIGGQAGYKLASLATEEELSHAVASLRSRAMKISRRAKALVRFCRPCPPEQLRMEF